jgi:hypothetical protein
MTLWVGMLEVRPLPGSSVLADAVGAYVYVAGRAPGMIAAVEIIDARVRLRELEAVTVEWLKPYDQLPEAQQSSPPVAGLIDALETAPAAVGALYSFRSADEPGAAAGLKQRVEGFLESWIDGALEECGEFDLGDFGFVAEMRFEPDEEPEIGWAYSGTLERAGALFTRAVAAAAEGPGER